MSSTRRRAELAAQLEAADRIREQEEQRRAALSMYDEIAECDSWERVREILHKFAEKLGME